MAVFTGIRTRSRQPTNWNNYQMKKIRLWNPWASGRTAFKRSLKVMYSVSMGNQLCRFPKRTRQGPGRPHPHPDQNPVPIAHSGTHRFGQSSRQMRLRPTHLRPCHHQNRQSTAGLLSKGCRLCKPTSHWTAKCI